MKHIHAEWIKKWADGEQLEWRNSSSFPWSDLGDSGNWDHFPGYTQFRVKPQNVVWPALIWIEGGEPKLERALAHPNIQIIHTNGIIIDVKFIK